MRAITSSMLKSFENCLLSEEKTFSTIHKYMHDVYEFREWLGNKEIKKSLVLEYKTTISRSYAPSSVNAVLSSLNSFFKFMEWHDLRVKSLKIQKQTFASAEKELSKDEYNRLLQAASINKNKRLYLLMQTICSTGIRVSELRYITAEAVFRGVAKINCKGKHRQVFLPKLLCKMLIEYMKEQKIKSGAVFITKTGNPLDRSNIWSDMKRLCKAANVSEKKVFPHNLRHLFARTYYDLQKDIARLADILGHSNVNTTRIYTMESGEIHRKQLENLKLLRC